MTAVAVAPDGSWLASGGDDRTVRIWDAATGQERATLTGHAGRVAAVAVAPDGSWLATAGGDGTVRIWDAATGQERAVLTSHAERCAAVAVAPDGSWLASAGWDGTVRIWDAATGRERAVLTGHTSPVTAVAVAPDGSWLAYRRRGRDGADLGRGHRPGAGRADRPHQHGDGGGGRAGWHAGWPPAAGTGRCGSGTQPPGRNGPC